MSVVRAAFIPLLGALVAYGCEASSPSHPPVTGAAGGGAGTGAPTTGMAGASGVAGTSGAAGEGGVAGSAVEPGAAGTTGSAGAAAPDAGNAGSSGSVGTTGAAGATIPVGDPGSEGDGDVTVMPPYTTQPDLTSKNNPKGKSFHFTMDSATSAIFKGDDTTLKPENQHTFTRGVDVYVPAQYKDGTPAPVLVIQDGPGPLGSVKNALDNLTISKDPARKLPAFIAVAVANGGGDSKGSERGLEYDTMADRYARFIDAEVLPAVVADPQVKSAYPNLAFTGNPEGRATLGCSSGGAAAVTMAWFRPDLFRRVISYSGTLVALQNDTAPERAQFPHGAWDYHSDLQLVANNPRKELRMFLNVNEMDNGAGSAESGRRNWVIANQKMAAALKAKGYHYRFVFAKTAGHCQGNVQSSTLADALVWAWRGYPAP